MKTYLVGGAVRDELLGLSPHEHDYVVIGATPEQMQADGFLPVGKHFPVFLHPKTKEEYALARTERKSGIGHQGFEFFADPSVTLEEDLIRRDLSINAIAKDQDDNLIDPYGGQSDLDHRVLRHVSKAFSEDPLRVFRVARFMAQLSDFGFTIADETQALMTELSESGELTHLSDERIWQETLKALKSNNPSIYFETLLECHAVSRCFKEIDQAALARLKITTEKSNHPQVRFVALFFKSDCTLKSIPTEFDDLLHLTRRLQPELKTISDPVSLNGVLSKLDTQRRPQRAEMALFTLQILSEIEREFIDFELIESGIEVLSEIDYGQIAQNTSGDVRSAIEKAKVEALAALFAHRH